MTIKEIATLITSKNYVFQAAIPGTNFSQGKTTVNAALSNSESIESYLQNIAHINKANHLFIKLFTPNGSSFKARGEHLIFLNQQQPVATPATPVATPLNGLETAINTTTPKTTPMEGMGTKDYIDFKVLQGTHEQVKHQLEEAKGKIKTLETKVEDMHEENKRLIRENSIKDDKHGIALERAKLEAENEKKEGLSGLIGELKEPETLKMILGFLKPDHPMFKPENQQPALEGAADANRTVKYTDDAMTNEVLNDIPRVLSQKDGDTIAQIYLLFQEFVNKPEVLKQAQQQFLPDYKS